MTATVHLAGTALDLVNESGRSVVGDPGVTNAGVAGGEVVMTVGSGRYEFASSKPTVVAPTAKSSSSGGTGALVGVVVVVLAGAAALFFVVFRRRRRAT